MAEFSACKFNFGVDWGQHIAKHCDYYRPNCSDISELQMPAGVDFIANFVGWTEYNGAKQSPMPRADKEGRMITDAKAIGATPVWYAYIIAEGAKHELGLTDCNVGGGNGTLCEKGANYIRSRKDSILSQYKQYAAFAANSSRWGKTKPMIWALEPDFVQYTDGSQQGGGISFADAKVLLSRIADTIKAQMPNAWISMDISPWKSQSEVIPGMVPLDKIQLMNTSGGVSLPGALIKDKTNWSEVWNLAKKGMIADDGYGTGGTATNPNAGWSDVNNLKSRIADGVVALMEALPGSSWGSTIANLRSQLPETKSCNQLAVGGRGGWSAILSARVSKGRLLLTAPESGLARVTLVSPAGRTLYELGTHDFQGAAISLPMAQGLSGADFVLVRGEGWQAVAPVLIR